MKNNQKISIFILSLFNGPRLPRPFEAVLIRLQMPATTDKKPAQQHSANKSTDMCPPSDPADLLRPSQGERPAEQLAEEPESQIKHCRQLKEEGKKENWKHDHQAGGWKKQQVRAEHARNRARSTN